MDNAGCKRVMKLKILPPSLREKHRYILFKVISEFPIEYSDLESAIWNTMLDFLGEYGVAKTNVWIIKERWNKNNQTCIVRCNHLSVQDVLSSLGFITRLGDVRIVIKVIKISGTLKGLNKAKA